VRADFDPRAKYRLQAEAVRLLSDEKRLQKCMRCRIAAFVEAHRSSLRQTVAYRGVAICGSVWQCPVCSARISAGRAAELVEATETFIAAGGSPRLLTFTIPHKAGESLAELVEVLNRARRSWMRDGSVRRALAGCGMVGHVTGLEATYGHGSSWHPHLHTLLLLNDPGGLNHPALMLAWQRITAKLGRPASLAHGLDIRGGSAAAAYLAKLGLEVALAVRKLGRGADRFGVWQLLEESRTGSAWAGHAFREFAEAMKGRHHLRWSPGLKAQLGIADVDDQTLAEAPGEEDEALLALIGARTWQGIVRADLRAEFLMACAGGDEAEARDLLLAFGVDVSGLLWA